ncbi:MAG: hypothetical protein WC297_01750 [Candidatus Paceibacterota bacterium]|jgi:hypothetical protein
MSNFFETIVSFFSGIFSTVQFVALLISGALAIGIIFVVSSLHTMRKEEVLLSRKLILTEDLSSEISSRAWRKIEQRLSTNDEAQLRLALIEADKILDEILKISGHKGKTVADKLSQITSAEVSALREILEAHDLKNQIIQDPEIEIVPEDIRRALAAYKKFFTERGLI